MKDVSVLNLWERYAAQDFRLTETQLQENVQMMLAADRVVLQFPMYWYNVPWCVKRWVDQVFSAISFSDLKDRMAGKELAVAITTGSPSTAYQHVCDNGRALAENITWAYRGSAEYLGMRFRGTFFLYPDAEEALAGYARFVAE